MVKCTGAIFVWEWIESIGWSPGKIVIVIKIKWNVAFYKCLSLRVMVKCAGAIFVCEWIESIGWTPEKIVIFDKNKMRV